jgi:dephospho-CoA kinase
MLRNHLSIEEASARIAMQPDTQKRLKLVDVVIENGGTLEETRQQVLAALQHFTTKFPSVGMQ